MYIMDGGNSFHLRLLVSISKENPWIKNNQGLQNLARIFLLQFPTRFLPSDSKGDDFASRKQNWIQGCLKGVLHVSSRGGGLCTS